MPPFVAPKKRENNNNPVADDFNYELSLLVLAKKVGLSFDELNELTLDDFVTFMDMYIGNEDEQERGATQEDIDKFYAF